MKRIRLAVGIAVLVTATGFVTTSAQGRAPSHHSERVDFTFPLADLSAVCGFPVEQSLTGTLKTTLRYDRSGRLVTELDTQPGTIITFSSPASGKSFSFPFSALLRTEYTNGGAIGSPATSYGSGLSLKVPGLPSDAGRIVFDAVVVAITPGGIPIVAFTGVISANGHTNDGAAVDAAICRALAP